MNQLTGQARFYFLIIMAISSAAYAQPTTRPTTAPANPAAQQIMYPGAPGDSTAYYQQGRIIYRNIPVPVQPQEDPANIAQQASCVLQIDIAAPMNDWRADPNTAASLLSTTILQDAAAKKALGLNVAQRQKLVNIVGYPAGDRCVRLDVYLRKGDVQYTPDAANKLMSTATDLLRSALQQSIDAQKKAAAEQMAAMLKDQDSIKQQLADVRKKLSDDRDQVSSVMPNAFGSSDIGSMIQNLRSQKRNIERELTRMRNQLKNVEPPTTSPLAAEWQSVVDLRQSQLDQLKKAVQAGKALPADVKEQEAKLAEAKAQLAEAKQNDLLNTSNQNDQNYRISQARQLRTQIADQEDQLKPIDDQLDKLKDPAFAKVVDEINDLQMQQQQLQGRLNNIGFYNIDRARSGNATVTITVLGEAAN
jgi:hypothetical protein